MRKTLLLLFLMFSLMASGCVSPTGKITIQKTNLTYREELNFSKPILYGTKQPIPAKNKTHHIVRENHIHKTQNTTHHKPHQTQTTLQPSHKRHCNLSCSRCEMLDETLCKCKTVLFCDGNGICENGEYPQSPDCPDCDDNNASTIDDFNYTTKKCTHTYNAPPSNMHQNIIITEVMYDSLEKYDQHGEFIEIYNPSNTSINLRGWKISDSKKQDNLTFPDNTTTLNPKQHGVITGTSTAVEIASGALHITTGHKIICSYGLSNKGENITLLYPNNTPSDFINYSSYPKCKPGHSLERKNTSWSCSSKEGGTPGY